MQECNLVNAILTLGVCSLNTFSPAAKCVCMCMRAKAHFFMLLSVSACRLQLLACFHMHAISREDGMPVGSPVLCGIIFGWYNKTSALPCPSVYNFYDVNKFLLIRHRPTYFVVVACSQINHDVLVPGDQRKGTEQVLTKIWTGAVKKHACMSCKVLIWFILQQNGVVGTIMLDTRCM